MENSAFKNECSFRLSGHTLSSCDALFSKAGEVVAARRSTIECGHDSQVIGCIINYWGH